MSPLASSKRLVVKIGSSILVDEAKGEIRHDWLKALTDDVARLHKAGCEVVLVSSGAIRLGRTHLKLAPGALRLEESQAAAATGQIQLAHAYQAALARHGITVNCLCPGWTKTNMFFNGRNRPERFGGALDVFA